MQPYSQSGLSSSHLVTVLKSKDRIEKMQSLMQRCYEKFFFAMRPTFHSFFNTPKSSYQLDNLSPTLSRFQENYIFLKWKWRYCKFNTGVYITVNESDLRLNLSWFHLIWLDFQSVEKSNCSQQHHLHWLKALRQHKDTYTHTMHELINEIYENVTCNAEM